MSGRSIERRDIYLCHVDCREAGSERSACDETLSLSASISTTPRSGFLLFSTDTKGARRRLRAAASDERKDDGPVLVDVSKRNSERKEPRKARRIAIVVSLSTRDRCKRESSTRGVIHGVSLFFTRRHVREKATIARQPEKEEEEEEEESCGLQHGAGGRGDGRGGEGVPSYRYEM